MDSRQSASACLTSDVLLSASKAQAAFALPQLSDSASSSIHLNARNASSIPSYPTTSPIPQLKRKHGHKHIRQQLHSSLSTSATPTLESVVTAQYSTPSHDNASSSQPSRPSLTRSITAPSLKRPPASHSSYGVETITGPPPSFDTQRSLSQEKVWRIDRSKSLRMTTASTRPKSREPALAEAVSVSEQQVSYSSEETPTSISQLDRFPPDIADNQNMPTVSNTADDTTMEEQNEHETDLTHSEVASKADSKESSDSHNGEDLFLNIARTDAARPSSSRSEKQKSRISLPFLNSNLQSATSHNASDTQVELESATTPRAELESYHMKHASLALPTTSPYGSQLESEQGVNGAYNHRSSTLHADAIGSTQKPGTYPRSSRLVSDSAYLDRPKLEQNTTESTISTTAPSTVWDELDDLKSRIRKLELTGKLPQSSAAAMSSAERPRTANTAATTMSNSPKQHKSVAPPQSTIETVSSPSHPLLHDALANAQTIVSHDVYQKLQATAQDALQLAAMTSYDSLDLRNGTPAMTERQLRRRTESMCRSLTELAIALASEAKASQPAYRPTSREYHISPNISLRSRRYSTEAADRLPVNNRVQSRLETRRVSTQTGYGNTRHLSPESESPILPQYPGSGGRVTRPSGTFRTRRVQPFLDGANDEEEPTQALVVRPVSRATTDVGGIRRSSRDHVALSREYTSQHPMPLTTDSAQTTRTPLPSHLSTHFTSRRKYPSPGHTESSPLASKPSWGRISIVHQDAGNGRSPETESRTPSLTKSLSSRRSLGFASRLGSSVGNRLRAVKSERSDGGTTESINSSPPAQSTYS